MGTRVKHLLPLKFLTRLTKGFLHAVKTIHNKSSPGTPLDWVTLTNAEVARAPGRGLGTMDDAIDVLRTRVGAATTTLEVAQLTAFISSFSSQSANKTKREKAKASTITGQAERF